jgi:hypothetical protein
LLRLLLQKSLHLALFFHYFWRVYVCVCRFRGLEKSSRTMKRHCALGPTRRAFALVVAHPSVPPRDDEPRVVRAPARSANRVSPRLLAALVSASAHGQIARSNVRGISLHHTSFFLHADHHLSRVVIQTSPSSAVTTSSSSWCVSPLFARSRFRMFRSLTSRSHTRVSTEISTRARSVTHFASTPFSPAVDR